MLRNRPEEHRAQHEHDSGKKAARWTPPSLLSGLPRDLLRGGLLLQALLGMFLAVIAGVASVGLVGLSGWFIAASALAGSAGAASAFIVAYPSAGIRAFALVRVITRYLERLVNHRATFSILSRLRVHFFERALQLPAERLSRYRSGDLLNRATTDIDALDNAYLRVLVPTVTAALAFLGATAFLAYHSPLLAALLAVGAVLAGAGLPLVTALLGRVPGRETSHSRAELRTRAIEALEGLPEVRSYGAGDLVADRMGETLDRDYAAERRMRLVDAFGAATSNFAASATTLAVLAAGLLLYQTAGLAGPLVVMAVLLTTGVLEQTGALPAAYRALGHTRAAADRLSEVFDYSETVERGTAPFPAGGAPEISLENLTFRYADRELTALDGLSGEFPSGSLTAVTGPSGSGKSTLLRILAGELLPTSGEARYDETRTTALDPEALRRHVVYASQSEHVFDSTLRHNLLLSDPEASDRTLLEALRRVGLFGFVEDLAAGLDTPVGENGRQLSGGQQKRLAIARALLRRPDILLLDEPTGSLDQETAEFVIHSTRTALPEATIIVATHDRSLAATADHVLHLDRLA